MENTAIKRYWKSIRKKKKKKKSVSLDDELTDFLGSALDLALQKMLRSILI
jgi:chromatin remodeling complex protein RSC6